MSGLKFVKAKFSEQRDDLRVAPTDVKCVRYYGQESSDEEAANAMQFVSMNPDKLRAESPPAKQARK